MDERDAMAENGSPRRWPSADDRGWYVQRGIPLIPIATFLLALVIQTVLGVRYISALESEVKAQGRGQVDLGVKVEKLEVKIDAVTASVQQGSVPAALNQRAIADLERQVSSLQVRVAENERRLATETLRSRASRTER